MVIPKKRTKLLMVRLLPRELEQLQRAAKKAGMATSAWIRAVALEQSTRSRLESRPALNHLPGWGANRL
jgi:hypothetical protein